MKGDEKSPYNHYVQSGKLDPDVVIALRSLPRLEDRAIANKLVSYIPRVLSEDPYTISHPKDFTFSEDQVQFNNEKIRSRQELCRNLYRIYMITQGIVSNPLTPEELKQHFEDKRYQLSAITLNNPRVKQEYDIYINNVYKFLSAEKRNTNIFKLASSEEKTQIEEQYSKNIFWFLTHIAGFFTRVRYSDIGLIPDFSQSPIRTYQLNKSSLSQINIEE